MKQFTMSMYAGRDDMHKAMIEYIRELEAKAEANDTELQEKLRQQREACLKAVDELPEYDHGCPADHMEAILTAEIDNNGEEG